MKFRLAIPFLFAAMLLNAETPADELVKQIAGHIVAGQYPAAQMRQAAERGGGTVLAAAPLLAEGHPRLAGPLCTLIADAARIRSAPVELLKLYDPKAHQLFYTKNGLATERRIAAALHWKTWPPQLPAAAVRAAPRATLEWLGKAQTPGRIVRVLNQWSRWIGAGNERQHRGAFLVAAANLHQRFPKSEPVLAAVLGAIGHAKGAGLLDLANESTRHPSPLIRAQACRALAKIGWPVNRPALAALVALAETETDPTVQTRIGEVLGAFPKSAEAGKAALSLWQRTRSPLVWREILYSVAKTEWRERGEILKLALRVPEGGVLGVAMDAVRRESPREVRDQLILLAGQFEDTSPDLVDALGRLGDARALPYLAKCLDTEKRAVLRAKLVVALEHIPGAKANALIEQRLLAEPDRDVRVQLVRVAANRRMESALPLLLDLARDHEAVEELRMEAIWGLGQFVAAKNSLRSLARQPGKPGLYANLALARLGEAEAQEKLVVYYNRGTPTERLIILALLGVAGVDSPLIARGLQSAEFAVLLGAVRAAGMVGGHEKARTALRRNPHVNTLLASSLRDVHTLGFYLKEK